MPTVPIETAIAHCAALGFDGLELTVIPGWSTDAAGLTPSDRKTIRRAYDDKGIELCGMSGNTPLIVEDRSSAENNINRFKGYLDLAADSNILTNVSPSRRLPVVSLKTGLPKSTASLKYWGA